MISFIDKEVRRMMFGNLIGEGMYRKVYAHKHEPDSLVFKVEEGAGCFCNVTEWELWKAQQDTKIGKWLAPCVDISPCGAVLVQRRVRPLRSYELPKSVPAGFLDLKIENWGWFDDRIVCCDYGGYAYTFPGNLKKADWRVA